MIFTAESVRGLLDGTKTQTRRLMNPQPEHLQEHTWNGKLIYEGENRTWCWKQHTFENLWDEYIREDDRKRLAALCPYGTHSGRIWCKEAWSHDASDLEMCRTAFDCCSVPGYGPYCRATETAPDTLHWRSPLYMPRWASRLTLEIVGVRVQRVQEISDDDARAEGVKPCTPPHGHISPDQCVPGPGFDRARLGDQPHRLPFADRWDAINGKRRRREFLKPGDRGYGRRQWRTVVDTSASWEANPFVWTLTVRRLP
jgi:hypothetical protein